MSTNFSMYTMTDYKEETKARKVAEKITNNLKTYPTSHDIWKVNKKALNFREN